MLDIKFIRENKEEVAEAIKHKKVGLDLDYFLKLDKKRAELLQEIEKLNSLKNNLNNLIKESKSEDEKVKIIEKGKEIKAELDDNEPQYNKIKEEYEDLADKIPNVISKDTPIGKDEKENKVIRKSGEPPKFSFKPKDHMELGETLDIIDTKTAARISGARFNYIKGEAVMLQFALAQFILKTLTNEKIISQLAKKTDNPSSKVFIPVVPPAMIKSEVMKKMDRFSPIEDKYYLKEDELLLAGSAEHALGPIHMDQVLKEKELPLRYIGYSTAFRREAGSYGKDTRGILRCHQFDKMEMESFTLPENGLREQDFIVAIQEYIVSQLKIPYQVVSICSGDMGKPDFRQIDIECWIPSQNKYRETHTSDYMTDFQARRLNTRVKRDSEKIALVHMNDATAIAMGRILIAIMENYQQADGSIKIPEVLQPWMPGKIKIIKNIISR